MISHITAISLQAALWYFMIREIIRERREIKIHDAKTKMINERGW